MDVTDYNDGNWHGWTGGECPVHPKSAVDVKFNDGEEYEGRGAGGWVWKGTLDKIIAFRVTKPYVEPREFWVNEYPSGFGGVYNSRAVANNCAAETRIRCIHLREVIEE